MHHQTGGFVDHQQIGVFKHHVQRHGLGHEGLGLLGRPQFHVQLITRRDAGRRLALRHAPHFHRAIGHELLQVGAGELGDQLGQRAVDAPAVHADRHRANALFHLQRPFVGARCHVLGRVCWQTVRLTPRRYTLRFQSVVPL